MNGGMPILPGPSLKRTLVGSRRALRQSGFIKPETSEKMRFLM